MALALRLKLALSPILTYLGFFLRLLLRYAVIVDFPIEVFLPQSCTPSQGFASVQAFRWETFFSYVRLLTLMTVIVQQRTYDSVELAQTTHHF